MSSQHPTLTIGPYKMGSTLGVGTFGKVKLAVHEKTGQRVAIKVINKSKMRSMEMHEKVRREINILQTLRYPHVIRLYELIDTPTDIFMVIEYIPGGELFDYIVQKSRLHESEARRFFQQISSAVQYCHQNMVCHRDLKPENVLLDTNLYVKLADFGLSNLMKDGEFLKTSCGSPNYASPEVVSGKAYSGPEIDVWSCGVILYALLCGSLPFDDEHVPNLFKRIKHGSFTLPGHLSEASRSLIVRMLVVDPTKRITFRGIKHHPWFKPHLPAYLAVPLRHPRLEVINDQVVEELRKLGYTITDQTIRSFNQSGVWPSKETVAYQLLLDRKAKQTSYETILGQRSAEKAPPMFPRELQKTIASLQQAGLLGQAAGQATFPAITSPVASHGTVGRASTSSTAEQTVGSSATPPGWAATRWKLGIESQLDSSTLVITILSSLKNLNYEWTLVSSYKIRCRPVQSHQRSPRQGSSDGNANGSSTPQQAVFDARNAELDDAPANSSAASSPPGQGHPGGLVESLTPSSDILTVQLHRMASCKYLVDVQIFEGATITMMSQALLVTSAIYSAVQQIQQQTSPGGVHTTWSPTTPIRLEGSAVNPVPSQRLFGGF